MNYKLTIILAGILVILIAGILIVRHGKVGIYGTVLKEKRVFNIINGDISRIDLSNKNGNFVIKKDTSGKWIITHPIKTNVDTSTLNTFISVIQNLNYERNIGTGSLTSFGLSPASITATVTSSDKKTYKLEIGNKTPINQDYYAMAYNGSKGIFTITKWVRDNMDKNLFDLRNKYVVKVGWNDVKSITFKKKGITAYSLAKNDNVWSFKKPSYNRIKNSIMNNMIFELANLKASNIIDNFTDIAKLGLERPLENIIITTMNNKQYDIKIGNSVNNNEYAMLNDQKQHVYVILKSVLSAFDKPIGQMIDKKLLTQNQWNISSIMFVNNGSAVILKKNAKAQWDKNGTLYTKVSYVNKLIHDLTSLNATGFIGNTDLLKEPALTFTITSATAPTMTTISFGNYNSRVVYAKTSIDPRLAELPVLAVRSLEADVKSISE
ncbi:MAG: DUF4340 domain-containing protein [Deltaproteobacteria bacterium]|nr:DUF4340 domain-containing protein [Deltaproteobacteria bacterium]